MNTVYNRYIPQPDGSYRRSRMQEPHLPRPQVRPDPPKEETCRSSEPPCETPKREQKQPPRECPRNQNTQPAGNFLRQLLPKDLDTGDLIVILLLLLMAGDCREDQNTALLTLALYLFM